MPISKISISNCRSIGSIVLDLTDVNCLIGENGSGKSNIIKAINHFYNNLVNDINDESLFDKKNPHNDYIEITFTYDLSKLKKIAQSRYSQDLMFLHDFFEKILFEFSVYLDNNCLVNVTLQHYKSGHKKWSIPFEFRSYLKNVFPVYVVNSRNIKLTDWENIWTIIGDMSKLKEKDEGKFSGDMDLLYEKIYGNTYKKNLDFIKREFGENQIELDHFTFNQKLSQIYQLQLGGKEFKFKEEDLTFFSDGMNSNNYLKLLVNLIGKLSTSKIKEPMIVVDEPEIGLHPKLADNLTSSLFQKSKAVRFVLATHSSRVIKNIVGTKNGTLFHLSLRNNYTLLKKMRKITSPKETTIVTETEASYYFSKAILFVEGTTELELFNNKLLHQLFPEFSDVDIYSYGSNNLKLNLIHPSKMNSSIPYTVLLDMDKVIQIRNNRVIVKGDKAFSPLSNEEIKRKEKLLYGRKRKETLYIRNRINGICDKVDFIPTPKWFFIWDRLYTELINLIKYYSIQYNVYPVSTTIEGTIVNRNNYMIFKEFFESKKGGELFSQLFESCTYQEEQLTLMRLLVSGKCDTLKTLDEYGKYLNDSDIKLTSKQIGTLKFDKTEGWVSDFLEYFFANYMTGSQKKDNIETFKLYFSELYDIITFTVKQLKQSE
ncbi:retron Eco8 family effector endonuclease [Paenibacillus glycanilyticus]|uniref:retron Eco8 family effector endonuclease n=1 Tax=Paenibacillus glycanilyticus TaxID=126569 RepID=UPI00191060BE|nr:retron Eco8 family effector endonuclease [Paenibacillus glycanilyticus]